jgi:hypothetical protein
MKTGFFCFLLAVFAGSIALPQSRTASATSAAKKKKTSVVSKSAATKKKSAKGVKGTKKKTVAAESRQMAPTPDRYREIQQALVDKGYLKSEPNGVWDDQSAEALKQFQTDQHLSPTGKISSLSLIGLVSAAERSPARASRPSSAARHDSAAARELTRTILLAH